MRCKLHKCKASCCHNIPLPIGYLRKYADKIVNEVIGTEYVGRNESRGLPESELAVTSENPHDNKCPFLKKNYKCNIYSERPEICKIFGNGTHPLLKCEYIK